MVKQIAVVTMLVASCQPTRRAYEGEALAHEHTFATAEDPFEPLPLDLDLDRRAVELGEMLYADSIMSGDRSLSCLSCHGFGTGGADGLAKASVLTREPGTINTGTVLNLEFNFRFNWNGKFRTMLAQIDAPVTKKHLMDISWPELTRRLIDSPYEDRFEAAYADGVTAKNIRDALVTYQRSLITPNARFDRYLRGKPGVLTSEELEGYRLFKTLGCASCHQGINIGGNMFAKLGAMGDYFVDRANRGLGAITDADQGRFTVTGRKDHEFVFRVPSLRNVACTAPYLHDGSKPTLEDVVKIMGEYQLGRDLEDQQIRRLVSFLRTLTGELDNQLVCDSDGKR